MGANEFNIPAPIKPNGKFPVAYSSDILGAMHIVDNEAAMLAIPQWKRTVGTECYVIGSKKKYRLINNPNTDTTVLSDWEIDSGIDPSVLDNYVTKEEWERDYEELIAKIDDEYVSLVYLQNNYLSARQMMDTYWIEGTENKKANERLCLRPHLTGASVRYLMKHGAPARFVYPGQVYRNEDVDSGHERAFYQYEALIVDKDISFSSGIVMIQTILEKVFGRKINIRMREGFFPFVEPGYEIDMECLVCEGKGCKVCKHNGWLEIMPGGVIHPNVLKSAGLDPEEWTGFYINIGLERLAMMRYGIDDIRLFRSADLRFLKQFK
jgi:hypothetical protein